MPYTICSRCNEALYGLCTGRLNQVLTNVDLQVDVVPHIFHGLFLARQPPVFQDLLIDEVSRSHTTTHHSRWTPLDK